MHGDAVPPTIECFDRQSHIAYIHGTFGRSGYTNAGKIDAITAAAGRTGVVRRSLGQKGPAARSRSLDRQKHVVQQCANGAVVSVRLAERRRGSNGYGGTKEDSGFHGAPKERRTARPVN